MTLRNIDSSKNSVRLPLLITGCGRSGTKYISFALQRMGLDIGHESLGRGGIASWTMGVITENRIYGPPSSAISFEQIFHQTREPLNVINSCMSFSEKSWDFICDNIECPRSAPIEKRAAIYWLLWNEKVERIATWRYRIEDFPHLLFVDFCDRLKLKFNRKLVESIPRDLNTRRKGRQFYLIQESFRRFGCVVPEIIRPMIDRAESNYAITWAVLEKHDPLLCAKVKAKAAQYGYAPDGQCTELNDGSGLAYTKTLSGFPSI